MPDNNTLIQYIRDDVKEIKTDLKKLDDRFDTVIKDASIAREVIRQEATVGTDILRHESEKKFVNKEEFEPIKKLYDRLTNFSLGFIILIGTLAIGVLMWIREKIRLP